MKKQIAILYVILFSALGLFANNENLAGEYFQKANKFYAQGNYQQALKNYEAIDSLGIISPQVYYNMANAYYKLQNYPMAIYYYKKALKYNPGDKAARQNLQLARSKTIDKFEILPQSPVTKLWNGFILLTSAKNWTYISIAFLFIAFVLFVLYRLGNSVSIKRISFILGLCMFFLSGLSAFVGYQNEKYFTTNKQAVVIAPTIDVYSEPANKGAKLFTIHEGVEVDVLEEINGYVKIKLPNDKTGWIDKNYLMIV